MHATTNPWYWPWVWDKLVNINKKDAALLVALVCSSSILPSGLLVAIKQKEKIKTYSYMQNTQ